MKNDHEVLTVGMFKELLREFMVPELGKIRQELANMRAETKQELAKVRIEIRDDIIDVIDQNIQPQITSAVSRITRLERRVA